MASTLVLLAVLKIVGAIGVLLHRPWGFYLLLALLSALVPVDVFHLVPHPSPLAALLFGTNVGVLALLVVYRRELRFRAADRLCQRTSPASQRTCQ